jgi:3-hydroxyisobutyrate dehydrogenase-like beta-hydroxyacid dehydrogenase
MNVAFLGLGTMGAPMAANVRARGHQLSVWNRSPERARPLVEAGARGCACPAEAARGAEVIVTMLADVAAVKEVITGPGGVVEGLSAGAVVVDMSTVDPATARSMDQAVRARGALFVDAPVSGSRRPAEEGRLLVLAAGPVDAVERAWPVLEAMGRPRRVGDVGQGMALKLVLNALGAHMLVGLAAALGLGERYGLTRKDMIDTIQAGAFASPIFGIKTERILAGEFTPPDFTVALWLKDQVLALGSAASIGYEMPTEAVIVEVLGDAVRAGLGPLDLSGIVRHFESA